MISSTSHPGELEKGSDDHGIEERYLDFTTPLPTLQNFGSAECNKEAIKVHKDAARLVSPQSWPASRKNFTMFVACVATVFASVAPSSYSPGLDQISREFDRGRVETLTGVTIFTVGFAITPMALAPISEVYGRKPVFTATGILYVVTTLCCAVTNTFGGQVYVELGIIHILLLVSRFLAGVGSSTFSTMIGGLIADIYSSEERNTPMSLFSGSAVLGIGLGPLICGFIGQYSTWRWIFYMQTIVNGTIVVVVIVFFQETRQVVMLRKKARLLNEWHRKCKESNASVSFYLPASSQYPEKSVSHIRWKVREDDERKGIAETFLSSVTRPFLLLFKDPVVFTFSLWAAFSWSVLYICLSAVPLVFEDRYAFTLSQADSTFASSCIGTILATSIGIYQDIAARKRKLLPDSPESRLWFVCAEGLLLPIGLFIFGWTCRSEIHWIAPTVGVGVASAGIFFVYLAVFNYLADSYGQWASSAIAAQSFCRNALGGCFPLVTKQMYVGMTYAGASSLLGGIAIALSITPWVLVLYGHRIRERSPFMNASR
ncbi:MFS general substrate transporter [Aureobasidium melanogenum CBS 110374]|uniref:MFS general substrate transporter n=1 Tax=Aureobasidium melanogenum (strain CBS 110374) TaxID=1043003 RepID=A0A074W726_AURM1|nr:MFS general substrate transporter [Aureobasidium melanogenum CBS 110374]KEQ58381.1 MFS general substrate transporter [Aureobasidium melanogenum CBS 110374]